MISSLILFPRKTEALEQLTLETPSGFKSSESFGPLLGDREIGVLFFPGLYLGHVWLCSTPLRNAGSLSVTRVGGGSAGALWTDHGAENGELL